MAAAVGTAFNWVRVTGGVWTKIGQGPLVTGLPLQALEVHPTSGIIRTINWTLDGYSAAPPFYQRETGRTRTLSFGSPPTGHTGDYAVVLAFAVSPWAEFNILTDIPCFAHIAML